jgi:hypothetical protein
VTDKTTAQILFRAISEGILPETPMLSSMTIILMDSDECVVALPLTHEFLGGGQIPMEAIVRKLLIARGDARAKHWVQHGQAFQLVTEQELRRLTGEDADGS